MKRAVKTTIVIAGALFALAVIATTLAPSTTFCAAGTLQVTGLLRDRAIGDPLPNVLLLGFTDPSWASDDALVEVSREQIAGALVQLRVDAPETAMGSFPLPRANGAISGKDGAFTMLLRASRCWRIGPIFYSTPSLPPRSGLAALRIEITGRDPVILDVPEGTWTQHDGEGGLWATWDLGVVEVP